eukprot:2124007-Rhodomonas_salina.1
MCIRDSPRGLASAEDEGKEGEHERNWLEVADGHADAGAQSNPASPRQRGKKKFYDLKSGTSVVEWDLTAANSAEAASKQTSSREEEAVPRSGTKKDLRAKLAQQRRTEMENWRGDGGLGGAQASEAKPGSRYPRGVRLGKEESGESGAG